MIKEIVTRLFEARFLPTHGYGTGIIDPDTGAGEIVQFTARFNRTHNAHAEVGTSTAFVARVRTVLAVPVER